MSRPAAAKGRRLLAPIVSAVLGLASLLPALNAAEPPLLHDLFSEHAVLQRDRPIAVWGEASAGETVTVTLAGETVTTRADALGRWSATLPAMEAGGPHTLRARTSSGTEQLVDDILIGDVWLCSGQSNMELPVSRALNPGTEIRQATHPTIRLLRIAHSSRPKPLYRFEHPVGWVSASPQTVGDFSATCYFFARELQQSVKVPMGLINASWGGSGIEAWISATGLRAVGGFDERLELLDLHARDPEAANRTMGEAWEAWWRAQVPHGSEPWRDDPSETSDWDEVPAAMGDWKLWGVPELASHDGMVWFRRQLPLDGDQAAQGGTLSLGGIDEVDQTWLNGEPLGNTFGWGTPRHYRVPAGALRQGDNTVVVNVLNTWGSGGLLGPAEDVALRLDDGKTIPLAGGWRYSKVPATVGLPPRAPWESVAGLAGMHRGMIAPLGPYGLRGVVWYQGESNAGAPGDYAALLAGLMADWRTQFRSDLPFLIVQLPNFGPAPTEPVASAWADLREAQRRATAADPLAGLAVTIDIGDRHELHPPNKQAVGARLARLARHLVFGADITPSGPVPIEAHRDGAQVIVTFGDVDGGLVTYSADEAWGFELCGGDQESCRFVAGHVESERIVLDTGGDRAPKRVRFCWGDGPICNLSDASGLPAGPFEIAIE